MNNYFQLTENEQRLVLQQAAARYGLPAQAIEKDLWVSTITTNRIYTAFCGKNHLQRRNISE